MAKIDDVRSELEFYEQKAKEARAKVFAKMNARAKIEPRIFAQEITDKWVAYHGDCVEVIKDVPSDSIHYTIFSPPFSSLFTYSASLRDMGNSTDEQFMEHFDFLVSEMYRVTMPGRLLSFHCSDIPAMKERDGYMGLKDFPGDLIRAFQAVGFIKHSEVVIWKDPLIEATRTKALGLAHKQVVKDSCRCRNGIPDKVITVQKPGINPEPVERGRGFETYIGEKSEPRAQKTNDPHTNKYSHYVWQRYASPVWMDINQTDTLNIKLAREKDDERHICPLQLPVIARCIELWTNPGNTVVSWFAGIGSECYQALKMGRKAIGVELKKSYYDVMIRNLKQAADSRSHGFLADKEPTDNIIRRRLK